MKLKQLLAVGAILISISTQGQNIIAKSTGNASKPVMLIKWFTDSISYPEGIDLYRKESQETMWKKINNMPLEPGKYSISDEEMREDTTLSQYISMFNDLQQADDDGFLKLLVYIKSVFSPVYARYLGIMLQDTFALMPGKEYQYRLKTADRLIGESSPLICGQALTIQSPKDIQIRQQKKSCLIRWMPEPARYFAVNIYRKTGNAGSFMPVNSHPVIITNYTDTAGVKKHPEIFFADTTVLENTQYFYKLTAIDYFGDEGAFSEAIPFKTKAFRRPSAPGNLNVRVEKNNAIIRWEKTSIDKISGFVVRRRIEVATPVDDSFFLPPLTTHYKDSLIIPGAYYYSVGSIGEDSAVTFSPEIYLNVPDVHPPAPPYITEITADTGQISITWNRNREADLMGYRIYRSVNASDSSDFVLITPRIITDSVFHDQLPDNIKNFMAYKIMAVDSSYNNSRFSNMVYARMPDIKAPERPLLIKAISDSINMLIYWIKNADKDLRGYNLYKRSTNDSNSSLQRVNTVIIPASYTKYTDIQAYEGVIYEYKLSALDSSNNESAYSNRVLGKVQEKEEKIQLIQDVRFKEKNKMLFIEWDAFHDEEITGYIVFKKIQEGQIIPVSGLLEKSEFVIPVKDIALSTDFIIKAYCFQGVFAESLVSNYCKND